MIAYAQEHVEAAKTFVEKIEEAILFPLMTLMVSVALLVFLYGGYEFVLGANDETARTNGKKHMLWGIIGMLIIISAYAILRIALGTIGCDVDDPMGCGTL